MLKDTDLLNEYFSYFDKIFLSEKLTECSLIYSKYRTLKQEYNQLIKDVNSANFLTTLSYILDLDAQLQIMLSLLAYDNYLGGNSTMSEKKIYSARHLITSFTI